MNRQDAKNAKGEWRMHEPGVDVDALAHAVIGAAIGDGSTTYAPLADYGLKASCLVGPGESCDGHLPKASQPIPLASEKIRLYFEAGMSDGVTRILSLESHDGYRGWDFNGGTGTLCATKEDYDTGGDCEPMAVIGHDDDAEAGGSGLVQIRQFKIGLPSSATWTWDESAGAFMVITGADVCGQAENGLFFATFDGSSWEVQKDAYDCAVPLVETGHGPIIVALGAGRFALYFEDEANGHADKPLHVLYADASRAGDPDVVELEDWDAIASARKVHFRCPDGTALGESSESGIGDHVIFLPAGDLSYRVMYANLGGMDDTTWNAASSGIGMAVLLNP